MSKTRNRRTSSERRRNASFTRRGFFRRTARAAAGYGLSVAFARDLFGAVAPSDQVVTGHIGVGGMGSTHLNWFSSFPDVRIAAVCDVDAGHLRRARNRLAKKRPKDKVDTYRDFRELLERPDLDAVSVATPDHWHALITIHAFEAGKDVYCEKPLCYTLLEGRAMVEACKRNKRVFQLGTQIHAGENYHRVVELVRSGILGDIHTVRIWKTGKPPFLPVVPDSDPPPGLDWNMWLGPRPYRPYNRNRCHFNFRYFWDYSGGVYTDFWCHIADVAFWALKLGAPKRVEARGALNTKGMAETHEWIEVDFEFDGLSLHWTSSVPDVPGAKGRGIGACFEGTKGHLVTDYGSRALFIDGKRVPGDDVADVPRTVLRSPGHQRNFINCVKSRKLTESNLPYAHNMTTPMHLGLISFWMGRPLRWDGRKERFVGDPEADRCLIKAFRAPWSLPL